MKPQKSPPHQPLRIRAAGSNAEKPKASSKRGGGWVDDGTSGVLEEEAWRYLVEGDLAEFVVFVVEVVVVN